MSLNSFSFVLLSILIVILLRLKEVRIMFRTIFDMLVEVIQDIQSTKDEEG